ncbi:MAG: MG2 domain-containing protein [Myxococcota bacterium]
MSRWTRSLAWLMLAPLGCVGGDEPPTPPDVADFSDPETVDADASEAETPLSPRLRAVGPAGQVPDQIVVQLGRAFFSTRSGAPPEGTTLTVTPSVDGRLEISDSQTLVFIPSQGFAPDTEYTATLSGLSNADGPVEGEWSRTFKTRAMALDRAAVHLRDNEKQILDVDLIFAAPVRPEDVVSRATFTVGGVKVTPIQTSSGDRPNEARLRFAIDAKWSTEAALNVTVREGVPWTGDAKVTAPRASRTISMSAGPPLEILAVNVKEGLTGFYVDVVCKDDAVETERYYWDDDTWDGYWVSTRCSLTQDEIDRVVHISPAVDVTVAPAAAGFRLFGDFDRGRYDFEIDAGATTSDGGVLRKSVERTLTVPERSPRVQFASKGRYLPRESWDEFPIRHLNVDEVALTVRHIPPENLIFWMSGDQEAASARTSNVILKKTLPLKRPEDVEETSYIRVQDLLPGAGRGVYEFLLEADGARDAARLLRTDIQLIAKRGGVDADGDQKVWVWALDAHNGWPIQNVEVDLIRPSGQEMARCSTSLDGGCVLDLPADPVDDTPPLAIVARNGDDLTYLKFADLEVSPEGDVLGLDYQDEQPYRAAVLTERGVYRPGETVRLTVIARQADHRAPDQPLPVVVRLYDPRNKELRRTATTVNAVGVLTEDLVMSDFATTGRYRVAVEAGERTLGETAFNVEEFVPERMAVSVSAMGQGFTPDQSAAFDVGARWLFGGSAADSRVELTCAVQSAAFNPENNAAYHYGPAQLGEDRPRPVVLGVIEALLDEEGQATLSCPPAGPSGARLGAGQLTATAAVFEGDSGRSTVDASTAPLHPAPHYLGMRSNTQKARAGETAKIDGVVVDWDGNVDARAVKEITVEILHLEEEIGWVWDDDAGSSIRRRQLRRVRDDERTVAVQGGTFSFDFAPTSSAAGYLLVARAGNAETSLHVEGEGRRYWWDPGKRTVDQTPRPERPAPIRILAPEVVKVGQDVTVKANLPFDGEVLWTVETDQVLRSEWVDAKAGEASWAFTLRDFAPNVYVSALVVKDPHLESRSVYLPGRAHGVVPIKVEPEAYVHRVQIEAPEEVRPNSPMTVKARVAGGVSEAFVTIAAVDEGILQLTDFESPDPTDQIFAQRALGVDTYETVGWSLTDAGGPGNRTGGDAASGGMGRVQMVKPVALWSGLLPVNRDGVAEVTFDVPSYRGELRLMAVSVDKDRVGSAETSVTVRDPLVLQTTLPRFLLEGDMAEVPVFVSNMTGADQDVSIALRAEEMAAASPTGVAGETPPVMVDGAATQPLTLKAGESGSVVFRVRASRAPTAARFTVTATAGDNVSTETLEVPLVPPRPEVRRSERIALTSTTELPLDPLLSGWTPGSDRTTLWLTANPYGAAFTHMQHLIKYPYGCIEQTTSSTRPLLFVSTLLEAIEPGVVGGDVDEKIRYGIERVASMQTPSGGFAYWPGGSRPYLWPSAYATHMLLDAKDAGHDLPDRLVADALDWLNEESERSQDVRGVAYASYVLARAGRGDAAGAQRRLEGLNVEQKEERYLLMAAIQQAGDRRHEDALKRPDITPVSDRRENDWSFYSDRRRRAMMLNVFEELFPGDDSGSALADVVADSLDDQDSRWYTTQELAWGISGLGRRVQSLNAKLPSVTLLAGKEKLSPASSGGQGLVWRLGPTSRIEPLMLAAQPGDGPLFLHVTTDGVRARESLPTGGSGLALTRTYLNGAGQAMDPGEHALGDLIYARVTIKNTTRSRIQNIAMVDRIPAGWEIENPRLGRGELPDWADNISMWDKEHMNLRDDRLEVFGALEAGAERSVIYAVRAVTAGAFVQPDVSAEAMYDPRQWARESGGDIQITGPWAVGI